MNADILTAIGIVAGTALGALIGYNVGNVVGYAKATAECMKKIRTMVDEEMARRR